MTEPQVGDRISEYLLTESIGRGSFGRVFKAVHHVWKDRVVAIKVPTNPDYVHHLRREGIALHRLEHPNIVRALGLDPYADPAYFVMEYVSGCSLRELMGRHRPGLPPATVRNVLRGVLSGLQYAHAAGMIHRDIKPENILIEGGADRPVEKIEPEDVKITDFGLGRAMHLTTQSLMQSGSLATSDGASISGTLAYMAPEQRDGEGADASSDLYSVGVVLFEMLCGERPSGTETPATLRPGLPGWVDPLFRGLYARRDRRLKMAAEALAQLEESDNGQPAMGGAGMDRAADRSRAAVACPECGRPSEARDNFCIECGTQLAAEVWRCGSCRAYADPNDRYCIFCGAPMQAAMA